MRLKDRDTIWAYGKWERSQPLAVVVVPYDRVVAQAAAAENFMNDEFKGVATFVSILFIVVFIAAIITAMISARTLTKPISQLAAGANKLSEGNFEAKVDIRTGDELQDLGNVFNSMGPKLLAEQKMRRSLEIAREIQQRLLPQSNPTLDGFDIAGASIYCDETGGDYYDFIDLSEKKAGALGLAVGDITGHGIQAALLMATARGILRSHAIDHFDKLDKLMEDINEHLVADTDAAHFLTLFYAILDPENATIKCVSAGHDPAFWLCKESGNFRELGEASGIMLGVLEEVTYDDTEPVKLMSGDVILIGTDGIWEARNPDRQLFEKDRLQEIIRANAHKSAMEIINAVNKTLAEYRGGTPQEDDITMIVIKVL